MAAEKTSNDKESTEPKKEAKLEPKEHQTENKVETPTHPQEVEKEIQKTENQAHRHPSFFDDFQKPSGNKIYRYVLFLILAFLVVGVGFLLKPQLESLIFPQTNLDNYTPVSQIPTSMHLDINNPEDELLTFDKTINISGKTSPKSSVVISNGDLNWAVDADEEGEFSKVVDLKPGINPLIIYAFDPQGNNKTESRTIYYSEEKI